MDNLYTFDPIYQRLLGMDINGMDMAGMKVRGLKNAVPMADILDLSGKVAIVTGGGRGLGLCIVNRLCEAGASVVIADIAVEFADAAVAYFTENGCANIKFIKTDVRYIPQIQAAVDFTVAEFGKVDILVNNAAIWKMNRFFDLTEETWDDTLDVDLKGTVFFTQAVARQMVKQGTGGKIVNVASVAGLSMESAYGFLVAVRGGQVRRGGDFAVAGAGAETAGHQHQLRACRAGCSRRARCTARRRRSCGRSPRTSRQRP